MSYSELGKEVTLMEEKKIGEGVGFERIRRITGYLTGSLEKWNDAKRAEEADRVKHGVGCPCAKA